MLVMQRILVFRTDVSNVTINWIRRNLVKDNPRRQRKERNVRKYIVQEYYQKEVSSVVVCNLT